MPALSPAEVSVAVQRELMAQERLLWAGQPRGGIVLRGSDAFLIPFSLLWGGFALFWEYSVLRQGAPWFFALWGVPLVLAGLHIIAGRFVVDMKRRERTAYGLTSGRVLIVSGLFSKNVKSLGLRTLSDVSLDERADGSGTITFGPPSGHRWAWGGSGAWPGGPPATPAFELIPRAGRL